jgi:hypothetical protein
MSASHLSVLCEYDLDEIATVHCKECNANYCDECDRIIHRKPELRKHKRMICVQDEPMFPVHSYREFVTDMRKMDKICAHGPTISFSAQRLNLLELKFKLYEIVNARIERLCLRVRNVLL